jgi:hypothetical protein
MGEILMDNLLDTNQKGRVLNHFSRWRFIYILRGKKYEPITVAARSQAWTVFVRSNTVIVGSNPTRGMDVCVRLFCV